MQSRRLDDDGFERTQRVRVVFERGSSKPRVLAWDSESARGEGGWREVPATTRQVNKLQLRPVKSAVRAKPAARPSTQASLKNPTWLWVAGSATLGSALVVLLLWQIFGPSQTPHLQPMPPSLIAIRPARWLSICGVAPMRTEALGRSAM